MQRQVYGDTPSFARELLDDVSPEQRARAKTMDEQGYSAFTDVDGTDLTRAGLDGLTMSIQWMRMHARDLLSILKTD
jgi:hypothetical protein